MAAARTGSRRVTLRRVLLAAGALVLAVVVVLVLAAVAPFALRERGSTGAVPDTAMPLPGRAGAATDALRGLGYTCSDAVVADATVQRSCGTVSGPSTSSVQLLADRGTGAVRLVQTGTDRSPTSTKQHRAVLDAVGPAIGLPPKDQARLDDAVAADVDTTLTLGWGSAVVHASERVDDQPGATLRVAGDTGPGLRRSRATLRVPVDALAAAAEAHGYTCTTPEVRTIRGCDRPDADDGYGQELSFQGTGTATVEVYLSVTSLYHRDTRSRWLAEMTEVLGWVDTGQTRELRAWLAASADAPGGEGYVDGLPISFLVRAGTWEKETFGVVRAECARFDDLSSCEP
ncbi:hypothetical protein [Microlunatus spumicola]